MVGLRKQAIGAMAALALGLLCGRAAAAPGKGDSSDYAPPKLLDGVGLLRYGITFGLGLAVHAPYATNGEQFRQQSTGTSVMPYLAVTPSTWWQGDVTREYCAVQGSLFSSKTASDSANAYARALTRRREPSNWAIFENRTKKAAEAVSASAAVAIATAALAAAQARASTATTGTTAASAAQAELNMATATVAAAHNREASAIAAKDAAWAVPLPTTDKGASIGKKSEFVKHVTGWNIKQQGRCWSSAFGFYGGFPSAYEANFETDSGPTQFKMSVRPLFSAGLAYLPIPYLSVLFGVTRSVVEITEKQSAATADRLQSNWAWSLTIGGTLDVIKPLLAKY